jgi:cardiolipin synthase
LELIKRVRSAEERVWLVTPYFIPPRRLIQALGKAAKRGVDVQILTSAKTDVKLFQTLQFFYYPYLMKRGVKIYQYTEKVLHAKNVVIDDWMIIGSSNFNHRSVLHDLEVDLVIQKPENRQLIVNHF